MIETCFFILGCGRVGSTLLYRILREHPRIALSNEIRVIDALHLAYEAVVLPYGQRSPRGFMGLVSESALPSLSPIFLHHVKSVVEEYYVREFGSEFTHFGEKLPSVAAAAEAKLLWPDTRYIVLVRDPRDVVCSYLSMQKVPDPTVLGPRWEEFLAQSLEDFAHQWALTYNEVTELLPEYLLIDYAALVQDPLAMAAKVLEYLGIGSDPAVEAAAVAVPGPRGHGTSVSAAASVQRWRRDLSMDEAAAVMMLCQPAARRLGCELTES